MSLSAIIFASCGESSDDGAAGKTTISFWHFQSEPGQKKALEGRIAEFEKANPDVHVELQDLTWKQGREKLMAAFSSGQAPDVVELGSDWVAQYSAAGVLADQAAMKGDSLGRFADYLTAPGKWKDGVYAWPWTADTRVLFVNTELLAGAGMDTTVVDTLWSDVLVKAERLLKPPTVFGFGA
ncbi:MAG TPA: extracellular solute-binding protein, partial [Nitrosomonas sp.]|nr:extracellular solute-binding protein [Nitrosomonas sp.]